MENSPRAGSSPATDQDRTDHDRNFKELLTAFFVQFLELFFPKLAKDLDPDSIEFLSQEVFVSYPEGRAYQADIVAKARFKGEDAFFIIHVEHQSTAPAMFPRRFFRYYSALLEKYDLPVYPIVVYSHDSPKKAQPNVYKLDFPDGPVLRFYFRVVQLNRLNWRKFVKKQNPVASALMAKMKIADRDRPRVKAECLRLMVTLRLDRAKMRLIARFVDSYLNLNPREEQRFNQALESMKMKPAEKEEVMEILTSWERRGMEKGIEKGREEGLLEGQLRGARTALLDVITWRFGPPDEIVTARIREIDSPDWLRAATQRVLSAASIEEAGL